MTALPADLLTAEAVRLMASGQLQAAEQRLRTALAINARHPEALHRLGIVALSAGRAGDALALFDASLGARPRVAAVLVNRGLALKSLSRFVEAIDCLCQARELDPGLISAYLNQAEPLQALGRLDEAAAVLEAALSLEPERADIHNNLANIRKEQGRLPDALAEYAAALALDPGMAEAFSNRLATLKLNSDMTAAQQCAEHCRWNAWFGTVADAYVPLTNAPDPARPLRIGYVSPDCHTALPAFINPVLAAHDRQAFKVYAYYNNPQSFVPAGVTARNLRGLSDQQAFELVRKDAIDVLIDIAGHTGKNRLGVFARRAAPVQMTWLDYLGTTGVAAMDYRITDVIADPPGDTGTSSETLLHMPGAQWCWQPPAAAPAITPLPTTSNGYVTFGSFNNYSKITDGTLVLWRAILDAVPDSRLVMAGVASGSARERAAMAFGSAAGRIDYLERVPVDEYRTAIGAVDIALDPQPFSGATTTLDALWQGAPVLTLRGPFSWSRSTASLLTTLEMSDWIAADPGEYSRIAVERATDLTGLAEIRAGLRRRLTQSSITDVAGFVRALEGHYRSCWQRWCAARNAPADPDRPREVTFDALLAQAAAANREQQFETALTQSLKLHRYRPGNKVLHAVLAQAALGWARSHPAPVQPTLGPRTGQSIAVVICSIRPAQFAALSARLAQLFAGHELQIVGIHDARSLAEGYNRGAAQTHADQLVFCHDDIAIPDDDFGARLLHYLETCDVVGVVGASKLVSGDWRDAGLPHVHGHIIHQLAEATGYIYLAAGLQQTLMTGMQSLDGVFIAARRKVWEVVRFDELIFDGFHLYDLDFTQRAAQAGFTLAVACDLLLVHYSMGRYDATWRRYKRRFENKFAASLDGDPSPSRHAALNVKLADVAQVRRLADVLQQWHFGAWEQADGSS